MPKAQTLTVDEAAEVLGVSRNSAYASIKAGTFPVEVIKVGKRILIPKKALTTLLGGGDPPKDKA